MINIDELMEACRQTDEAIAEIYAPGPAVTCTRTFTILPLRYAVVGGNRGHRAHLPELPPTLQHLNQAVDIKQASYAVRTLREGFLYVLEKRRLSGQYHWHRPYRIDEDGTLSVIEPGFPWTPPTPSPKSLGEIRQAPWMFNLHDLDDLQALRLFYSPDPLTLAAQQKLLERCDSLPAVNVARYTTPSCAAPEPHVLTYDQLDKVADFAAESDPTLRKLLARQLHSQPQLLTLAASRRRLSPEGSNPNARGIAIVVEDAIGITQELNAWRNAAMEHLKEWLETTAPADAEGNPGASHERRLLVAKAFIQLQEEFSERKAAALTKQHVEDLRTRLDNQILPPPLQQEENRERLFKDYSEHKRREFEARAESGEFARLFEERYLSRVNLQAMWAEIGWFNTRSREAKALAETRTGDHLAWLTHPKLLEALAIYDEDNLGHGLCFAHQTGLCVMGMEVTQAGAELIGRWWSAQAIAPHNLALRAFTYNQRSIAEALELTRARLNAQPLEGDTMQKLDVALKYTKELAAEFSRIDAHLDLLAQHLQPHTAGALAWLGQLGREVLRVKAPGNFERVIHRRLSSYLVASLGEQAVNMRLAELAQAGESPSPGRVAAPILRRLDQAYVDNLRSAHSNSFFRLRVASGLLLLEAGILLLQGHREDRDARFWSEVSAAALTTAAAGMELLAVGTEQALATVGQNSVTARGTQISLGRYRLWGVGLAAAGGLVGVWWDAQEVTKELEKPDSLQSNLLVAAYNARITGTLSLLLGQGGIAISQAGAYFSWLAISSSNAKRAITYRVLAGWSSRLAANRTAMLLFGRSYWLGGAVVISSTISLLIFDGNALEKWCDRCCFSLSEASKRYPNDDEELTELFNSIDEVV